MTQFHGYNTPRRGQVLWDGPINENFRLIDEDMEVRDVEANLSAYSPKDGAKFFSTDTGAIYVGDGSNWNQVASSPPSVNLDDDEPITFGTDTDYSIEYDSANNYLQVRDEGAGTDILRFLNGGNLSVPQASPASPSHLTTKSYVDSAINGIDYQDGVIDERNDPPSSLSDGDRYLVDDNPTGDFSGHPNEIAEWNGSSWDFFVPDEGWAVFVEDVDTLKTYNGSDWVVFGSTLDHGAIQGLSDDDHTQYAHTDGRRDFTGSVTFQSGLTSQSDIVTGGNALTQVGGTTDASLGAIRLANSAAINWRGSGDSTDYGILLDQNNNFFFDSNAMFFQTAGSNGLIIRNNQDVEVPNGGLTVSGGDIQLATGQSIVDGSGTSRFVINSGFTAVQDQSGNRLLDGDDDNRVRVYARSGQPFSIYDQQAPATALEYTTGASAGAGSFTFDGDAYLKDGNGLVVGDTAKTSVFDTFEFQVSGTSDSDGGTLFAQYQSSARAFTQDIIKSRSGTVGTFGTALQSDDNVYEARFGGDDGSTTPEIGARINVQVSGTVGTDSVPMDFIFETGPSGGSTEALRIDSAQDVTVQNGDLLLQDGSAADPSLSFANDGDTGIYRQTSDVWNLVAGGSDIARVDNSNGRFAVIAQRLDLSGGFVGQLGGTTDASSGAIRLANDSQIAWRNSGDTANQTLSVDSGDNLLYEQNGANTLAVTGSSINVYGQNIVQVGGTTDASSGAIRLANGTSINARNSGDTGDFGISFTTSDRIAVSQTLDIGNEIIRFEDTSLANDGRAFIQQNTSDSSHGYGEIEINAVSGDVALKTNADALLARRGGNVEIPNGELQLSSANNIDFRSGGSSQFGLHHDNANGQLTTWDDTNGLAILHQKSGGNVEIPNGNLELGDNRITSNGKTAVNLGLVTNWLWTAVGDGSGSAAFWDAANSQPILEAFEGGNVEIPNGDLDMTAAGPAIKNPTSTITLAADTDGTGTGFVRLRAGGSTGVKVDQGGAVEVPNVGSGTGTNAVIDSNGVLLKDSSSERYKKQIRDFQKDPTRVLDLQPKTFVFTDTGQPDLGYIAEDVAEVAPELVTYDNEGRPDSVKYDRAVVHLTELVKDLEDRLSDLEDRVAA